MTAKAIWVAARLDCTPQKMFDVLCKVIEADTKARNERAEPGREYGSHREGGDWLTVFAGGSNPMRPEPLIKIFFRLDRTGSLEVLREGTDSKRDVVFTATTTVRADRTCVFVVDGEQLEPQDVSERALLPVFFPDAE